MRAKNRMREICTSGSVRGGDGNILAYSACCLDDDAWFAIWLVEPSEAREGIGLDDAGVSAEPTLGMGAGTVCRVEVGRGRRVRTAERTIVAHRRPKSASAGLSTSEDRDRCIVEVDAGASPNMRLDQENHGGQRRRHRTHPIGERRDIDRHTLTTEPLALTVERKVKAELPEHDLGEETGPGATAVDRVKGCGFLRDRLAGPAREALAHMLDDPPACRDTLERLGDVLAELTERRSAAARTVLRSRMHDAVTREMLRQRAASGLVSREGRDGDRLVGLSHGGFSGRLLQILETEFELFDAGAALRRWPEPLAAETGRSRASIARSRCRGPVSQPRPPSRPHAVPRAPPGSSRERRRGRTAANQGRSAPVEKSIMLSSCNALSSADGRRTPAFPRHPPVDSRQQIAELSRRDRHSPVGGRGPQEPALVQALGVKAGALAVMPDHLDQIAAAASEDEEMAAVRVAA